MKRINPMTMDDFQKLLRLHGIPCSCDKAKALIRAGIFGSAAVACPGEHGSIYYFIRPRLMERWIEENYDEDRPDDEEPWIFDPDPTKEESA